MDEDLKIFNISYDNLIKEQKDLQFPKLMRSKRNSTLSNTKKASNIKKNQNFLSLIYEQTTHTGRSSKKSKENSFRLSFNQEKWKNSSFGFTPKLKHLIAVAPSSKLVRRSPKSMNFVTKSWKTSARPNSATKLIDWKASVLENYIIFNKYEFNSEKDPSLWSEYMIKEITTITNTIEKNSLRNTVRQLCKELMQNDYYVDKVSDTQLLVACKKLFGIRQTTLDILKDIHEREYLLLRIVTESNCSKAIQKNFLKLTYELIRKIRNWKTFSISKEKFIYLGENYLKKIYADLSNSKKTNH